MEGMVCKLVGRDCNTLLVSTWSVFCAHPDGDSDSTLYIDIYVHAHVIDQHHPCSSCSQAVA